MLKVAQSKSQTGPAVNRVDIVSNIIKGGIVLQISRWVSRQAMLGGLIEKRCVKCAIVGIKAFAFLEKLAFFSF